MLTGIEHREMHRAGAGVFFDGLKPFEPIYADFCEEYYAALVSGEKWRSRWICLRFYKDFAKAVGLFGIVRMAKTAVEYWEKIA